MKALSIRQPWPWAILHAGKRIENRDWRGCFYRGPLLIHAAKGCTRDEHADAARFIYNVSGKDPEVLAEIDRGGIVGVCNLVDAVQVDHLGHRYALGRVGPGTMCLACGAAARLRGEPCPKADPWACGPLGLVLADVRRLPFVPFKGALGFFDVPDDLVPGARL